MISPKKILAAMKRMDTIVRQDIIDRLFWYYFNTKRSEPTFDKTRAAGKRWTNCMGGIIFACKLAGIPASALQWYGAKDKIQWLNDTAKADAKKHFDIFRIKRTVKECVEKGILIPADIITYMDMMHTNAYYGNGKSFDTGHAYCNGSGEGAKYSKWIGSLAHPNRKIAYIFRLKGNNVYRVQVGSYSQKANADKRVLQVAQKSGFGCFIEQTDMYRVYCGSFEQFKMAINRLNDLNDSGVKQAYICVK